MSIYAKALAWGLMVALLGGCACCGGGKGRAMKSEVQNGQVMTVKGEVVDLSCFLALGARGEGHKECAVACAKAGNPVGIVTDEGRVYVAMGPVANHTPGSNLLLDKMASTVEATGKVYHHGGVTAIYIDSVK
jgi:hypothetical protein